MRETIKTAVRAWLLRVLPPLVRVCIKAGVGVEDFSDLLKVVYARVAHDQFAPPGSDRPTDHSQIASLSGLNRNRVGRLLSSDEAALAAEADNGSPCERVILGWITDPQFRTRSGSPKVLPVRAHSGPSFDLLVRRYSGDRRTPTLLLELSRAGAIERPSKNEVKLIRPSFASAGWDPTAIRTSAEWIRSQLQGAVHNLESPGQPWMSHRVANVWLNPDYEEIVDEEVAQRSTAYITAISDSITHADRTVRPSLVARKAIHYSVTLVLNKEPVTLTNVPRN